jgi:hypothetical protein
MREHEAPYFDQREKLEFPTETWAAQELRKANVLRLAAAYVEEPERSRMHERGQQLAERAWADLQRFATRASLRSLAICMREGLDDARLQFPVQGKTRPRREWALGEPCAFVPQKARVRQQLRSARGLCKAILKMWWPRNLKRLWALVRP